MDHTLAALADNAGEWRGSRNQRLFSNPAAVLADRRVQACIGTVAEWLRQSCAATAANVGARRRTLRPAAALRIAEVRPLDPAPILSSPPGKTRFVSGSNCATATP